jgi:ketosteroid isomerase-like protein
VRRFPPNLIHLATPEIDNLRHSYAELNHGNIEAAIAALHPDAVWEESGELPGGDVLRGREQIRDFLGGFLESWSRFEQEIEDVVVAGDRVCLLIHLQATGRGSGAEVDARYAHVWTMRDGLGARVDAYRDQAEARRSLEEATAP